MVYSDSRVYLERYIRPAHQIKVQVVADAHGNAVHLGEREGSIQRGNRLLIEESPSPSLTEAQRETLFDMALQVVRVFAYQGAGTVEFLMDGQGNLFFTEIKARLQVEHPATEMRTRLDVIREQLRIAAGEPLGYTQADIRLQGCSMLCRVNAQDPARNFMPAPGVMEHVRLPKGPEVRVDTYVYSGCPVPEQYMPLVAKVTVWAHNRSAAIARMRRALEDLVLIGTPTNLSQLQHVLYSEQFEKGGYDTELLTHEFDTPQEPDSYFRDMAAVAAVLYLQRYERQQPSTPQRLQSAWHRSSRRLPE